MDGLLSTPKIVTTQEVKTIKEGIRAEMIHQRRNTPLFKKNYPPR